MDSPQRTIAKSVSWQLLGLGVMTALTYSQLSDLGQALTIAAGGAVSGFVLYAIHERLWTHVQWGQRSAPGDRLSDRGARVETRDSGVPVGRASTSEDCEAASGLTNAYQSPTASAEVRRETIPRLPAPGRSATGPAPHV